MSVLATAPVIGATHPSDAMPLTVSVPEAGRLLGIGRDAAYRAAAAGQIPTLRLGRRLVVPVAKLRAMLGELDDNGGAA